MEEMAFAYQGTIVGPPTDDVCPICFDDFTTPSMTDCRHWFCADCILKYWYSRGGMQICKCPKCNRPIHKLKVEASLFALDQDDEQNVKILERVMHYNLLYVGGSQFFSMVCFRAFQLLQRKRRRYPWLSNVACWIRFWYIVFIVWYLLLISTQRTVQRLMNPDLYPRNLNLLRAIAFMLAFLCVQCGFDLFPTGFLTVYQLFDLVAVGVAAVVSLVGLIRLFRNGGI